MSTTQDKLSNRRGVLAFIVGAAAIAAAVGVVGLTASSGDGPANRPAAEEATAGLYSLDEVGSGIAGGMTEVERQLRIAIPGGETLYLPAELGVDLAGGFTGVETYETVSLPDGSVIVLPTEMGIDLAGGWISLEG